MGNSLRCCIACILPCGALDVIRIVHSNGTVEEVSGEIYAGDIMKANPKHVLRKHCSEGVVRIIVLAPDAQLKKGQIYFLSPAFCVEHHADDRRNKKSDEDTRRRKSRRKDQISTENPQKDRTDNRSKEMIRKKATKPEEEDHQIKSRSLDDQYLAEIMSDDKRSSGRCRRKGRVGIWRPHLQSISEDFSSPFSSSSISDFES